MRATLAAPRRGHIFAGMKRCKHEGCDCPVPTDRVNRGDQYCSEFCAGNQPAQSAGGDNCGCGHPSCRHHGE